MTSAIERPSSDMTDPRLQSALGLFRYLRAAQELRSTPVRDISVYRREEQRLLWFVDLPEHDAVEHPLLAEDPPADGAPVLFVRRVPVVVAPVPDERLTPWLTSLDWDDPARAPELRPSRLVPSEDLDGPGSSVDVTDVPGITNLFEGWLPRWQAWAEQELAAQPVRDLYADLHHAYTRSTAQPEEFELVLGVGLLGWRPLGHETVRRHLVTSPCAIDFDAATGGLSVRVNAALQTLNVELEMLDPEVVPSWPDATRAQRALEEYAGHPLDSAALHGPLSALAHSVSAAGSYDTALEAPATGVEARASFAPALILRNRSRNGIADIYKAIVKQLESTGVVPDGLLPLIDPDHVPPVQAISADGAVIPVDDEVFLPMPVNDRQREVVETVDRKAQTLVQGPPGTGKTHTAAVLISHLLARGQRVLVTAQTDRALKEVREKLPEQVRSLAVSVVGAGREDMASLKTAVESIASRAADHDGATSRRVVDRALASIEDLRRRRSNTFSELLAAREGDVRQHEHLGYRGSLAVIAARHQEERPQHEWVEDVLGGLVRGDCLLRVTDAAEWLHLHLQEHTPEDRGEAGARLVDLDRLPSPADFAALVHAEREAVSRNATHEAVRSHGAFDVMRTLSPGARTEVQTTLHRLAAEARELSERREQWIGDALGDVQKGRDHGWRARRDEVASRVPQVEQLLRLLPRPFAVTVDEDRLDPLARMAAAVRDHLAPGGALKTDTAGEPKIGWLTTKVVKESQPLFDSVRVNGLPPTSHETLDAFVTWCNVTRLLDDLDRQWPVGLRIPQEDTPGERLRWHVTELSILDRVLALADELAGQQTRLAQLGLPTPRWDALDAVTAYAATVDAASAADALSNATAPLERLNRDLTDVVQWADAAPAVGHLATAVDNRDPQAYDTAHRRVTHVLRVRSDLARHTSLTERIGRHLPGLAAAVSQDRDAALWAGRLRSLPEAWRWAATGTWILSIQSADVNALQERLAGLETEIRTHVQTIASTRAWAHAVSDERLSGQRKADLLQYAQLVRRLGKGTGKYAGQRQADIRDAMARCRPAVPVWIMPLYRIAEQLRVEPDMFDVVIIDEASQAGAEATFLQYLARRIVVIGDDRQVSPSAVGVEQQQLRDLAMRYIPDDRYRATWEDPKVSLFDSARMRFGGMITLTEHRRCVPEIIGFSNAIAYEPDGIRLLPVRQYGADRLDPIVPVHVPGGFTRGVTQKINQPEVDAIVEQVVKCCADPRYDGLTMGVISLLGKAQARTIEKALLDRIPDEWEVRELRCGDSVDFQGSERDVVFLSMVAAAEPGQRLMPQTQEMYVQRYNVAASRAKDQLWLFHSVTLAELTNPEDLRYRLLEYCTSVARRGDTAVEGAVEHVVPEDERVPPFDSLFEQRVFNRIVERGYTVVPQHEAMGYSIDLVVVGGQSRVAVECDGDHWHGPAQYQRDLGRQRELERCGWTFFRVRESDFYVDKAAALAGLWALLDERGVRPAGWYSPAEATATSVLEATGEKDEPTVRLDHVDEHATGDVAPNATPTSPPDTGPEALRPTVESENHVIATHADPIGDIDSPVFRLRVSRSPERHAEARLTEEGFVVLGGSYASNVVGVMLPGYKSRRDHLIRNGQLQTVPSERSVLRLVNDQRFTSPSQAASIMNAGSDNGRIR
ncbi:AAA domain-containing protein [Aquipuribacter hungaricus]|uniref:AAA domain-containing protein n=1 Tax=Aquipuribacter hungaricus TaxID=545624 RepID=A0ABV7WGI9_9MICO